MNTMARSLKGSLSRGWEIFADRTVSTHVPFYVPIENGIIRLKNDCLVSTLQLTGFSFETADIETINMDLGHGAVDAPAGAHFAPVDDVAVHAPEPAVQGRTCDVVAEPQDLRPTSRQRDA